MMPDDLLSVAVQFCSFVILDFALCLQGSGYEAGGCSRCR